MKLSWNSLKISIAGARLSHLVQKDKIWDHGSMTEQVRNIFHLVEKARNKKDIEPVKKYVTTKSYEQLNQLIKKPSDRKPVWRNMVLIEVSIIKVTKRNNKSPDRFTALIRGKRKAEENKTTQVFKTEEQNFGIENFSEQWIFIRQGDWWLLDEMK